MDSPPVEGIGVATCVVLSIGVVADADSWVLDLDALAFMVESPAVGFVSSVALDDELSGCILPVTLGCAELRSSTDELRGIEEPDSLVRKCESDDTAVSFVMTEAGIESLLGSSLCVVPAKISPPSRCA
jgi:hypothetical protein